MKWDRAAWDQRGGRTNSIRFREFRLDLANQCLWRRGDSGQEARVALTPKAFDVLRYLVQHAGQLVTQDELLDALWLRACVQPEVLKHQVLKLRKALGDDRRHPRYIETLPRRGYWFIASTSSEVAETDSNRHVHREATALLRRALELTRRLPDAQRAPPRNRHSGEARHKLYRRSIRWPVTQLSGCLQGPCRQPCRNSMR